MDTTLARHVFDRWITKAGPDRLAFLGPTWELVRDPADPPVDSAECLDPLRSLLGIAEVGDLRLDDNLLIDDGCAPRLNRDLDYSSPTHVGGQRSWLEVDALHLLGRHMRITVPGDGKEQVTRLGRALVNDPVLLWDAATAALGLHRPRGLAGAVWELTLAWLVREDAEPVAYVEAMAEAAEQCGGKDEAQAAMSQAGILCLYTACRALHVFGATDLGDGVKPPFHSAGRRFVIDALRAAAFDTKKAPTHL